MRCLVTGASGHLGSYVVRKLLAHKHTVTALVRPESDLWRLADVVHDVEMLRADIANIEPVRAAIMAAAPEVVVHTAWFGVTRTHWNDARQLRANVVGSLDLVAITQEAGVRCWIGIGSQAEYGPTPAMINEDSPTRPVTAYGVAKLSTGLLTQKMCELAGIRHLWLRLLSIYGPKDDERHLIPTVIRSLLARERPALTAGEQRWDYLYVEDAADAVYAGILSQDARGIFNLGSGTAQSIRCIVESIRDMVDSALPIGFGDVPYPAGQVSHLEVDRSRFSTATGWVPQTSLKEGLQRTLAWHQYGRSPMLSQAQKG